MEPEAPPPPPERGSWAPGSAATVGILLLLVLHGLYLARSLLLPIALAVLASLILSPAVRALGWLRLPAPVGAALVMAAFVAGAGWGVTALTQPAAQWVERAPRSLEKIEQKLRVLKEPLASVDRATESVEEVTRVEGSEGGAPEVEVRQTSLSEMAVSQTRGLLGAVAIFVILLYFLLASGDLFLRKLVAVMPRLSDKKRAVMVTRRVEHDISRYLLTVVLINTGLGIAVALAMRGMGMPNPVLWGALAGFLNLIPYLGALVTAVILAGVALLTFDGLAQAAAVVAVFVTLTTAEGWLVTPYLLGRTLLLSPIVILLGVLVWSWLWGIPGALMAVPSLVAVKLVCEHVERLQPVATLLER